MKIRKENEYLIHFCPGCDEEHLIPMWGPSPWSFNEDYEKPTLAPSVKHTLQKPSFEELGGRICHYFIKDGMIQYCNDSWHTLAGKTVEMQLLKS